MNALKTGLRPTDLLHEAWVSVRHHPGRSAMTTMGTLLGSLAFVATLGITGTLSAQVSESFDVRRATEVTAETEIDLENPAAGLPEFMGPTAVARLTALNGVDAAGPLAGFAPLTISRGIHSRDLTAEIPLTAVSPGSLNVIEPTVSSGRTFDAGHIQRGDPVILLSDSAARQLQITRTGTAVFIQNQAFTVTGIYDDVQRQPDTLGAALIPTTATTGLNLGVQRLSVIIGTTPGAAQQIGGQAALALQPNAPEALTINAPPDPQTLRREVEGSVTQMSLLASLVALIAGSISIGNSATATMVQRIPEIGLRRALGARRSSIFAQLLAETTFLGLLGGAAGALLGVTTTIGVALINGWVPLIEIPIVAVAIGAGCAAGTLAGFLPALRATRISPTEALSR